MRKIKQLPNVAFGPSNNVATIVACFRTHVEHTMSEAEESVVESPGTKKRVRSQTGGRQADRAKAFAAGRDEAAASMQAEVDKWKERAVELERELEKRKKEEVKWREMLIREKAATARQEAQAAKWKRRFESKDKPTADLVLGSHSESE